MIIGINQVLKNHAPHRMALFVYGIIVVVIVVGCRIPLSLLIDSTVFFLAGQQIEFQDLLSVGNRVPCMYVL